MNRKAGLDYFPFDVDFFQDEKIQFVSARFGLKGEIVSIRLLCKIYRQGYYTLWDEDAALLFAKGVGDNVQHSFVNDIVSELLKRGFFDRSIFERFSVLTSRGIQKRYFEAAARRKNVSYNPDFILINVSGLDNVVIENENVYILKDNADILTQSKEENIEDTNVSSRRRKNPPTKKTYSEDSTEMQLALLLSSEIKKNNPNWILRGGIQTWCDTFRLMIERDNREYSDITSMIKFCQWDEFWRTNILSPGSLRKQYDQLTLKREEARKKLERQKYSG